VRTAASRLLCIALVASCGLTLACGAADARDEVAVSVHHAYGTQRRFVVEGRVAERRGGREYRPSDTWLANVRRTLGSLRTEELKGAPLRLTFGVRTWALRTDDDGYFALRGETPPGVTSGWQSVLVEVVGDPARANAPLLVVPGGQIIGLISDVDDTVLVTEVGDRSRMLAHTFLENPLQRQPYAGAAAWYRSIIARNALPAAAPVIYLTGSPRQLLPAIRTFLEHNGFPAGPIIGRKITDGDGGDPLFDQERYKLEHIETILEDLPDARFVLSGDDGEHDPEVYRRVREKHPARIEAVYIRRVSGIPGRPVYEGQLSPP
jgi:phosphatidate phosphatase APP1